MRLNVQRRALPAFASDVPPRDDADEDCLQSFQDHLDYIHCTLLRLGAASSDVDDLLQDVFLALRGAWGRCDKSRPLRPYLFGIAFRILAAHRRKRKREVPFGIVEPFDPESNPDERMQSAQAHRLLMSALDQIPLSRRAVLVLHELDEIPVTELAATLNIPRFTVYGRLRKGRRELATALRSTLHGGER